MRKREVWDFDMIITWRNFIVIADWVRCIESTGQLITRSHSFVVRGSGNEVLSTSIFCIRIGPLGSLTYIGHVPYDNSTGARELNLKWAPRYRAVPSPSMARFWRRWNEPSFRSLARNKSKNTLLLIMRKQEGRQVFASANAFKLKSRFIES